MTCPGNIIEVGKFAEVKDSGLAVYGVKKGDKVYVCGTFDEVSKDDPYTKRVKFIAASLDGDGNVPQDGKPFVISPNRLDLLSEVQQSKYKQLLQDKYGDKDSSDESTG